MATELENLVTLYSTIIAALDPKKCNDINNDPDYQEAIDAFVADIEGVPAESVSRLLNDVFTNVKIQQAYKDRFGESNACKRKIGYDIYRQVQKQVLTQEFQEKMKESNKRFRKALLEAQNPVTLKKKEEEKEEIKEETKEEIKEEIKEEEKYKPVLSALQNRLELGFTETLVKVDPNSEIKRNELKLDDICSDIQKIKKNISPNFFPSQFPLLTNPQTNE